VKEAIYFTEHSILPELINELIDGLVLPLGELWWMC
jgi:hypothetical protein